MAASKCRSGPETGREVRRVTADLAEYLSSDRYPLHSRLPPERQLCELLQVSRTVLRNGLEELEREGRIWRHVGKGTFVGERPQSVHSCAEALGAATTLSELLEARTLIEPQAARLAALRSEPSELALMKRYAAHAAIAENWASWDRWMSFFIAASPAEPEKAQTDTQSRASPSTSERSSERLLSRVSPMAVT